MPRHKGCKNFSPTTKVTREIVNKLREQALSGNPLAASVYLELEHRGYFNHLTTGAKKMKNKNTFNPMQGAKETSLKQRQPTVPAPDADNLRRSDYNNFSWGSNPVVDSGGAKSD